MISKSQIMRMCFECRAILHADICPHCGSSNIEYSMIELSLLLELRQQLKDKLTNKTEKRGDLWISEVILFLQQPEKPQNSSLS